MRWHHKCRPRIFLPTPTRKGVVVKDVVGVVGVGGDGCGDDGGCGDGGGGCGVMVV